MIFYHTKMAGTDKTVNLSQVVLVEPNNKDEEELPEKRSGHRIVVTTGSMYSIGGFNPKYWTVENDEDSIYPLFKELWKFNFATGKWTLIQTEGDMPVEMASHAALLIGNKLFVHGGTGTPFGSASSNQLHVCDLSSMKWKHIVTTGTPPEALYGHTITLVSASKLFTFGGTTGFEYRNDLHKLNLVTKTWERHPGSHNYPNPNGRYRHEAVSDDKFLYILGGGRSYESYKFEKIDAYNVSECRWEQLTCHPAQRPESPESRGFPKARRCHSAVLYKKGVYISGGYNGVDVFDDIWKLDLDTLQWSNAGQLCKPVYFHSSDVTKDGCMYIFGGVNRIDDERNSEIYRFWVDVPPLQEQCWSAVCTAISNIELLNRQELRELGIPESFLDRLSPKLARAC